MKKNAASYIKTAMLAVLLLLTLLTGFEVSAAAGQGRRLRKQQQNQLEAEDRPNAGLNKRMEGAFGGGMQMRVWARVLKLTDDQFFRLRQIKRRNSDDYLNLEDQIRTKRQALEKAIFNETFNEEEVKQAAIELAKAEGQRVLMKAKIQAQIRQILTTEQVRTFKELRFGNNFNLDDDEEDGKPDNRPADAKPTTPNAPETPKK